MTSLADDRIKPNTPIQVHSLTKQPALNGMKGTVLKYSTKLSRYLVVMENGTKVAVDKASLTILLPKLRFNVGDVVQCNCRDGWVAGEVVELNFTPPVPEASFQKAKPTTYPYRVLGVDGRGINVPFDEDNTIKEFKGKLQKYKEYTGASDVLRFALGDKVVCWCGPTAGWKNGSIEQIHVSDPDVFDGKPVPYKIKLADGMITYAPFDTDSVIREMKVYNPDVPLRFKMGQQVECSYNKRWVIGTVSKLRFKDANNKVFQGREAPYAIDLLPPITETIYAPIDDDTVIRAYTGTKTSNHLTAQELQQQRQQQQRQQLRFPIGTRVACNCGDWVPGNVAAHHVNEKTLYGVMADDGTMISVPFDVNQYVRALSPGDEGYERVAGKSLRFGIGTKVECNCGEKGWCPGEIESVHFTDESWPQGRMAPYRILLAAGGFVICPSDKDEVVRLLGKKEVMLEVD
jgi:hypothetical protein